MADTEIAVPNGSPPAKLTKNMMLRVQAAIRTKLLDPGSARFAEIVAFSLRNGHVFVCGTVNSKNKLGGYTGASPFSFEFAPSVGAKDGFEGTLPAVWSTDLSAQFFYESIAPACQRQPKY